MLEGRYTFWTIFTLCQFCFISVFSIFILDKIGGTCYSIVGDCSSQASPLLIWLLLWFPRAIFTYTTGTSLYFPVAHTMQSLIHRLVVKESSKLFSVPAGRFAVIFVLFVWYVCFGQACSYLFQFGRCICQWDNFCTCRFTFPIEYVSYLPVGQGVIVLWSG